MDVDTSYGGDSVVRCLWWPCAVSPRWATADEGSCSLEREARVARRGSRSREGARQSGWCGDVCVGVGYATLAVRDRDGACGRPLGRRNVFHLRIYHKLGKGVAARVPCGWQKNEREEGEYV